MDEERLRKACDKLDMENMIQLWEKASLSMPSSVQNVNIVQPTFIIDYPAETSPLTKMHRRRTGRLSERFELFINCKEIANAYSELNDPINQMEHFKDQLRLSEKGDNEAMFIDLDFVRALEYGMPPHLRHGHGYGRVVI